MKIGTKLIVTNLAIIALGLTIAFIVNYYNHRNAVELLEGGMLMRGKANALNLATLSGFGVVTEDRTELKKQIDNMAASVDNIAFIEVFNKKVSALATTGKGSGKNQVKQYEQRGSTAIEPFLLEQVIVTVAPIQVEGGVEGYICYAESMDPIKDSKRAFAVMTGIMLGLAFILTTFLTFLMGLRITKPIQSLTAVVKKASNGDLRQEVTVTSRDEVGDLAESFNKMIANLRSMVERIRSASSQVASAADEISASSIQIAKGAESQASAADQTSASMEEMSFSINSVAKSAEGLAANVTSTASAIQQMGNTAEMVAGNADNMAANVTQTSATIEEMTITIDKTAESANKADSLSEKASLEASSSGEAVIKLVNSMSMINDMMSRIAVVNKNLEQRSEDIGEILEVIGEIADQTSLLALNATIEAARAGEAGRGFAVVADEVRKLSERSVASTKKIAKVIKQVQKETIAAATATEEGARTSQEGLVIADQANAAISRILEAVDATSQIMRNISLMTEEQSVGARTVLSAVEEMNRLTLKVTESTKEQAHGIKEVIIVSAVMASTTAEVKNATNEQKANGENVVKAVDNINEIARSNLSAMGQLSFLAQDMAKQSIKLQELVKEFQTG